MSPTQFLYLPIPLQRFVPKNTALILPSLHEKSSRFEPKKLHADNAVPCGWNLPCEKVADTPPKNQIKPLKETKLGVARALFDL